MLGKMNAFGLAFAAVVALNAPAFAAPYCQPAPNRPMVYLLALTVPATFCGSSKDSSEDPSCKNFPKESAVQLHGLWPNYKNSENYKDNPQGKCNKNECKESDVKDGKFCKYPEPEGLYQSSIWKKYSEYMTGTEKCLERHEWSKHGVCSGMNPETYFNWSLERTKHISDTLKNLTDITVTREEFNQNVKDKLPELSGALRLNCKGRMLNEIHIMYEWGASPGKPIKVYGGGNHFGNCKGDFIIPSMPMKN